MKRIQKLYLRNFKAFRDQEFDFDGRHVLIYGGNGSGKSSIYWALYTLFEASAKADVSKYFVADTGRQPQSLRHVDAPPTEPAFLEMRWQEADVAAPPAMGTVRLSATENTAAADVYLREGSRASDFVTYRLFQHFNGSNRHVVNVWPAFVRDVFPYYPLDHALFQHAPGTPKVGTPLTYLEALYRVVEKQQAVRPARNAATEARAAAEASAAALAEQRQFREEQRQAEQPTQEGEEDSSGGDFGELDDTELASAETTAAGATAALALAEQEAQDYLTAFNGAVAAFVGDIATNTNQYLQAQAPHGQPALQVTLTYPLGQQLGGVVLQILSNPDTDTDDFTSILRRDQSHLLAIELRAQASRAGQTLTIPRPQTFLNEARLTQLAFALRVGALLQRNPASQFNVLCLDDVLLSLDMGNRLEVLDWLFAPEVAAPNGQQLRLLDHYQIFFFTHDQELYRTVQHYIKTRSRRSGWKVYELTARMRDGQPGVYPIGEGESLLTQARRHFDQNELAACGNALRSFTENKIKEFLPFNQTHYLADGSFWKTHTLGHLIDELQKTFNKHGENWGILGDIKLYKDLLLNPLSHDNQHTTVHEAEMERLLEVVMPELDKLRSEVRMPLRKEGPTELQITEIVTNNGQQQTHVFTFQLGENWRLLTFHNGAQYATDPDCWIRKHEVDGTPYSRFFPKPTPVWQPLSILYKGRCQTCGATPRSLLNLIPPA